MLVPRFIVAALFAAGLTLVALAIAKPAKSETLWPCAVIVHYCTSYTPRQLEAKRVQNGVTITPRLRAHIRACLRGVRCKR